MTRPTSDPVVAAAELADRTGATAFECGRRAGTWYAAVTSGPRRVVVDGHSTSVAAAYALAERLLENAWCACTRRVALVGATTGERCRWRLMGDRWEKGCDAPPMTVDGDRGDQDAAIEALAQRLTDVHGPVHGAFE